MLLSLLNSVGKAREGWHKRLQPVHASRMIGINNKQIRIDARENGENLHELIAKSPFSGQDATKPDPHFVIC